MAEYAKNFQILPFVSYVTLFESSPFLGNSDKGLSKVETEKLAALALKENVILILPNLIDR